MKLLIAAVLMSTCAGISFGADDYPTDTEYPVRICGNFHVKDDKLYLEVRQTVGAGIIDLLLVPRKLPVLGSVHADPPMEVIGKQEIDRVKTMATQNAPTRIVGCAYSGRFPILGTDPQFLIEKLTAMTASN